MGQRASGGARDVVRLASAMILLAVNICGCASAPPPPLVTPVEVKVPIETPVYCRVGKLDKPALPISTLKAASAPADTIRAYAATVAILKGALRQRDLMIAACATPAVGGENGQSSELRDSNAALEAVK